MSAAVVFLLFFICLIIAIPISIALGIVSVLPGAFDPSFTASGQFVIRSMLGGIDSFPLLAVPMFVLSGMIMAKGGISKKIFDVFAFFIGKLTAGMPCAVIVTCLFYGAISGSAPATVICNSDRSGSWWSWGYHTAKYSVYHVWYGIWRIRK